MDDSVLTIPEHALNTWPKLITDTTLRDGNQDPRFALFPLAARLKYFDLLHALDNGAGRIEAVEVFIYQNRDLWTIEKLLERGYEYPQVTTWTRATPKDIKQLIEVAGSRIRETGMLASASDHHIFDKLEFRSKHEAIEKYLKVALTACEHDIVPRIHLEDITRADIFGWVIPFIQRVLIETEGKAKFRACDTLGIGIPDPHAALPLGIPRLISTLVRETGAEIEFHGHNDFGLATANTLAALLYGAKRANTAFAGLGERTGNTPLEQIVAGYVRLYGNPGFELGVLSDIARLIDSEVIQVHPQQPVIGHSVFSTQAGIHQTGIERQKEAEGGLIYLPFDPAVLGRYIEELNLVGAVSGIDGIAAVLNKEIGRVTGTPGTLSNVSRVVKRVYDRVQEAYDGVYDESTSSCRDYRMSFFAPEELLAMAIESGLKLEAGVV
jgi:isopropylmalate/homocitrate/citramalate synthase